MIEVRSTDTKLQNKQAAIVEAFQQGKMSLGELVQEMREAKGWTREQLGKLYGRALSRSPIAAETIQRMEQTNNLPSSEKRRYVLAKLLDIPVALLGLNALPFVPSASSSKKAAKQLDLVEYRSALDSYWNKHYTSSAQDSIEDVTQRIYALHDVFPYTYTPEKKQMVELLCGFNIVAGNIERDRQHHQSAVKHLDNAVIVARENDCYDFYAAALHGRGVTFLDKGQTTLNQDKAARYLNRALNDFTNALKVEQLCTTLPTFLKGYILTGMGITQSHLAKDNQDITQAIKSIDKAEKLVGEDGSQENKYFTMDTLKFGEEEYHIDRASTLLGSTNKKQRNPNEVLAHLTLADSRANEALTRRGAFINIQRAKAYFDKGDYPRATALAMDALSVFGAIESWVNIARVAQLYNALKATSYGSSFEVAQLEVELMLLEHPDLAS